MGQDAHLPLREHLEHLALATPKYWLIYQQFTVFFKVLIVSVLLSTLDGQGTHVSTLVTPSIGLTNRKKIKVLKVLILKGLGIFRAS
jgi:hypothetical protein